MRNAVITGASRGIGFAIADIFLKEGYRVFISSRNLDNLYEAEEKLKSCHKNSMISIGLLDVRDTTSVESFFDKVYSEFNHVDVLVNNAGIGGGGLTLSLGEQHWLERFEVNVHGTFRCTMAYLRRHDLNKEGRIINISSTGGKQGVLYASAYSSSKHAVVGFTKSLGLELAKTRVTVNAICPGFVETDLAEGARLRYAKINNITVEEMKKRIEDRIPIGRYILPEEVARVVAFVASSDSSSITAQTFNVCGGLGNY